MPGGGDGGAAFQLAATGGFAGDLAGAGAATGGGRCVAGAFSSGRQFRLWQPFSGALPGAISRQAGSADMHDGASRGECAGRLLRAAKTVVVQTGAIAGGVAGEDAGAAAGIHGDRGVAA